MYGIVSSWTGADGPTLLLQIFQEETFGPAVSRPFCCGREDLFLQLSAEYTSSQWTLSLSPCQPPSRLFLSDSRGSEPAHWHFEYLFGFLVAVLHEWQLCSGGRMSTAARDGWPGESHRESWTQVPIIKFETEEEAVAMANDTEYGLASYFYTTVPPPPPPPAPPSAVCIDNSNAGLLSGVLFMRILIPG